MTLSRWYFYLDRWPLLQDLDSPSPLVYKILTSFLTMPIASESNVCISIRILFYGYDYNDHYLLCEDVSARDCCTEQFYYSSNIHTPGDIGGNTVPINSFFPFLFCSILNKKIMEDVSLPHLSLSPSRRESLQLDRSKKQRVIS